MSAIDLLTAHFERMRGQKYTVPGVTDAEGKPFVIHFDPPTNRDAAQVKARSGGGTDQGKLALYTVIYLAKDAEGKRLFEDNAATVQALTERVNGATLNLMAQAIMQAGAVTDLGN